MSTGEDKEDLCAENEGKIDLGPEMEYLEPKQDLPTELALDRSSDHNPPDRTIAMTSDDTPVIITKDLSDETMDIGEGDHKKETTDINVLYGNSEEKPESNTKNITDQPMTDSNVIPAIEMDILDVAKPTFLESVSSLISENVDNESVDEELVLKWDDDEEEESVLSPKDDDIEKKTETDIKSPDQSDNKKELTDDIDNIADDAVLNVESKGSEDDILDDEEDLLSEIDAQIAELGASISKAENEGLMIIKKTNESIIITESTSNKAETSVTALEKVTTLDITEESSKSNPTTELNPKDNQEHSKQIYTVSTHTENTEMTEMEIEEALLEDNDIISQENDDIVTNDNLKQNKSYVDTNLVSPNAESFAYQADVNSDTKEIVEKSSKISETKMEMDSSANLEDSNLTLDQNEKDNLLKNIEVLANSTKLDNSVADTELETSGKDDSFAHDSSNSFEERKHGVNKPNVMLEIPTQELIDLDESVFSSQDKEFSLDEHDAEESNISVNVREDKISKLVNEKTLEETDTAMKDKSKGDTEKRQSDDKVTTEKQANEITTKQTPLETEHTMLDEKSISSTLQESIAHEERLTKNDVIPLKYDSSTADNEAKLITPSEDIVKSNSNDSQIAKEDAPNTDIEMPVESNLPQEVKSPDQILGGSKTDDKKIPQTTVTKDDLINLPEVMKESGGVPQSEDSLLKDMSPTKENVSTDASKDVIEPSTSQMALQLEPVLLDDVAEVTDSLGLLAESSRIRDEDDVDGDADAEDQETSEHDDDDDDFDPDDDNSNLPTADHSEDSSPHSESDLPKQDSEMDTVTNTDKAFDLIDTVTNADEAFNLLDTIDKETGETDVDKETGEFVSKETDKEFGFEISNVVSGEAKEEGEMDIDDDIVCEEVEVASDMIGDNEPSDEVDVTALKDQVTDVTKDTNEIPFKVHTESKLRELLKGRDKTEETKSPSKKKLEIAQLNHVVNIVDLESSSEDEGAPKPAPVSAEPLLTSINISREIDVMSSGDNTSEIVSKEGETVITVPSSPALHKITSRLNTSEITIKTASATEPTLVIPETKMGAVKEEPKKPKFGALEVFNLDSDDEETPAFSNREPTPEPEPEPEPEAEKPPNKCINSACVSHPSVPFYRADPSAAAYYESRKKRLGMVCQDCLAEHLERAQKLVQGVKNFTPLLEIEEVRCSQDLVEISDSDSDDEASPAPDTADKIGAEVGGALERRLADMINATWEKFKMDARLMEAQEELTMDLDRLDKESAEVNQMLDECQVATDKLRCELYATFDVRRQQLQGYTIYDTPEKYYMCPEAPEQPAGKRRLSSASDSPAKKPAGTPDGTPDATAKAEAPKPELPAVDNSKMDDDKDISVVTLSAEAAPADLPAPGEVVRAPLLPGQVVYAMRNVFGSWIKATILEVTPKGTSANAQNFTMCRIKFDNKSSRNAYKLLPARCLAYHAPASVRLTIGTRVIALFKDTTSDKSGKRESYSSGVVAEVPNPVNKYRYLVFFDDGYAQYVSHAHVRLVCEFSSLVWEEVHPYSREFVREYLLAYPERPMVRLHTGQSLKTEWNGKWWLSKVTEVDASLVQVYFEQDKRTEWIYRGSTRLAPLYLELQAAEKHRARPLPRNRAQNKLNMPYVEYTRLDEQQDTARSAEAQIKAQQEEIRRQRAVAKKSTTPHNLPPQQSVTGNLDAVTSRVVYYTPKNAVKPYKMTTHNCGSKCKRTDVLALKDLRTYNPLAKPLLSGWERQIVRFKGHKEVMYRAPCGRRLRNMAELHRYLRLINSDMGVDLFDFGPNTHCLAEFVLNKCIVGKKDLSHGKENVPVPCVNYYDESLPEFCSYNTERTPTAGVPLNLDPDFLCGCDCTDDCRDKSKCACWKMTLEGARTIGMDASKVGYVYKRLPDPLPSGIYECNSRCKCKSTCLNRVAQHPLQLKLQVFKTLNRGWGIRALNDVPKGSFLCIYAGNLLTDATANLDGLNEGDEYLAELDYIEVVEQMKEGYEDDIPEPDKKLDKKELGKKSESESEETQSEEEAANSKSDADDGDFEPGYIPGLITGFNKRLRKRDKKKQKNKENGQKDKEGGKENEEDCITISDDEELREPSSFAAQPGMGAQFISKYRSVRTLFGEDEACYIMDAKVQGNIGRYLNHSCTPNVFVQNVFVDSHDPRFPWVAFFALAHIRAGTELTWNYNYDVGSVPGKVLYCYCGAPNCRGRLL